MAVIPFKSSLKEKIEAQGHDTYLPPLLSVAEVCKYLGLGQTTVREMIARQEIPHIKVRSRIRVSVEDLKKYLERNTRKEARP